MKRIVLVTGGFDPLHSGHIEYFHKAKSLGDQLIVGINSDKWLSRKKGRSFMPFKERKTIIENLEMVNEVIGFDDADGTATEAIKKVKQRNSGAKVIFANGGDREKENVPEENVDGVEFVFGVGGIHKINSSSWILENWKAPKIKRSWGYYRELYNGTDFHVKELVIAPHSKLSMQRHEHRSETWNIVHGKASIKMNYRGGDPFDGCAVYQLHPNNPVDVPKRTWHQGCNETDKPAHIIEIWKGKTELLTEDDIERYDAT
tara:strand:+ start:464 stop:1243 length:780 start_codon:yes stop_codon:yes gene_type:complete